MLKECVTTMQSGCCLKNATKMLTRKRKARLLCLLIIFSAISLTVLQSNLNKLIHHVKQWQYPWEVSVEGDIDTCLRIVSLLVEPSSTDIKELPWPTPSFVALLTGTDNPSKQELKRKLCTRYTENIKDTKIKTELRGNSHEDSPNLISTAQSFFTVKDVRYLLGDVITLRIEARDRSGTSLVNGRGDFFKVRAYNTETRSSISASKITCYNNGTYDATIEAFRTGPLKFQVLFGNSGHFIDLVKQLTSQRRTPSMDITATFSDGYLTEATACQMYSTDFDSDKKLCNFTNKNGEPWFCQAPKAQLMCHQLADMYTVRRKNALDIFKFFPEEDRGSTTRSEIQGTPAMINVEPNRNSAYQVARHQQLKECSSGISGAPSAGFWISNLWFSTDCRNRHFSRDLVLAVQCLTDRTFYFLGDSTARQWFEYFLKTSHSNGCWTGGQFKNYPITAREVGNFYDVWEPRKSRIEKTNTTFYYRAHGPPLQNGAMAKSMRYISNELDQIEICADRGKKVTVVIAIGPHFLLYHPSVFAERLSIIRQAAERLLLRNPEATVIVKGTSTFDRGEGVGECCLTDWLSFRLNAVAKDVLKNSGVIYLDVWEMTLSHDSADLIHPVDEVITQEIDLALSYSCSP